MKLIFLSFKRGCIDSWQLPLHAVAQEKVWWSSTISHTERGQLLDWLWSCQRYQIGQIGQKENVKMSKTMQTSRPSRLGKLLIQYELCVKTRETYLIHYRPLLLQLKIKDKNCNNIWRTWRIIYKWNKGSIP